MFCLQAYLALDRNAEAEVSISELLSFIRRMDQSVSRQQLLSILSSMDTNFDRTISKTEFLHFLGIMWAQRFLELERDAVMAHRRVSKSERAGTAARVSKLEQTLTKYFGPRFRELAFGEDALDTPFGNLLKLMGAAPTAKADKTWALGTTTTMPLRPLSATPHAIAGRSALLRHRLAMSANLSSDPAGKTAALPTLNLDHVAVMPQFDLT